MSHSSAKQPFTANQLSIYSKLFKIVSVLFFLFAALGLIAEVYSILIIGLLTGVFLWVQAGKYKNTLENMEADSPSPDNVNTSSDIEFSLEEDPIDISIDVDNEEF